MTFQEVSLQQFDDFDGMGEYLQFERVDHKYSNRPDLNAFILLDGLVPGEVDIISCAEHDQIWLNVDIEKLNAVATEAQMIELIRCGVLWDEDVESLLMFT